MRTPKRTQSIWLWTLAALVVFGTQDLRNGACATPAEKPKNEVTNKMPDRVDQHFGQAELVALLRPVSLLPAPGAWSGTFAFYQGVRYRVVAIAKGAAPVGETLTILHPVVAGSPTADQRHPKLRSSLFDPAHTLVVFARTEKGQLYCLNENDGVLPLNEELRQRLEHLAGKTLPH